MRGFTVLIEFIVLICVLTTQTFAVSISLLDYPTTINDGPFTVTASISGATTGTNYLKIDLFKDTTTNYFGETFNGSDWYGGSAYSQYLPITVQSGVSWIGQIQGRIASPTATQYDGSGSYKLRVRRYTGSGGYTATEANNGAVLVSINLPTLTPTPTNPPIPTNTPIPTLVPTIKNTSTPIPKLFPTNKIISSISLSATNSAATNEGVLGMAELTSNDVSITPTAKPQGKVLDLGKILIVGGVILLCIPCGILLYKKYRTEKEEEI